MNPCLASIEDSDPDVVKPRGGDLRGRREQHPARSTAGSLLPLKRERIKRDAGK